MGKVLNLTFNINFNRFIVMKRVFKVLSPSIVKVEQFLPRDWWFVFHFREDDSIKSVCVYAKEFVGDNVEMAYYDETHGFSTFMELRELWRILKGVKDGELFMPSIVFDVRKKDKYELFVKDLLKSIVE